MLKNVRRTVFALTCVLSLAPCVIAGLLPVPPAEPVQISYELRALGGTRWQYTYDVANLSWTQAISEFTIWFERNSHRNLGIATPTPPAGDWDELIVQPDPFLQADGYYDALSLTGGLLTGGSVSGFAVAFDWLGAGTPGPQRFDIVDPVDWTVLYSGFTVPEPALSLLLALGGVSLVRRPCRPGRRKAHPPAEQSAQSPPRTALLAGKGPSH